MISPHAPREQLTLDCATAKSVLAVRTSVLEDLSAEDLSLCGPTRTIQNAGHPGCVRLPTALQVLQVLQEDISYLLKQLLPRVKERECV